MATQEDRLVALAQSVSADVKAQQQALGTKAPLVSPAFTGSPTAPTQTAGNNTTKLATTAFVTGAVGSKANLASPAFTGTPTAPTPATADSSTKIATTALVAAKLAALPSPSGGAWQHIRTDNLAGVSSVTYNVPAEATYVHLFISWKGQYSGPLIKFNGANAGYVVRSVRIDNGSIANDVSLNGSYIAPSTGSESVTTMMIPVRGGVAGSIESRSQSTAAVSSGIFTFPSNITSVSVSVNFGNAAAGEVVALALIP